MVKLHITTRCSTLSIAFSGSKFINFVLFGQVNAEIKRLLVASVGEDIGNRYM